MTSLADVAAQLRHVAEQLPIPQIGEAVDHAEAAAAILAETFAGTSQPEYVEAVAAFAQAHSEAFRLLQQFIALRDRILALAIGLAGKTQPASPPPHSPDRIDQIRRSLPRRPEGSSAQGRWLGPGTDVTVIRSGTGDEWYDRAMDFVRAAGPAGRHGSRLAIHMEVKLAIRMRLEQRTHETLIIDREVCGRRDKDREMPVTCDKWLKWFLAPGATLTVIEYDGTRVTYLGEGKK